MKKIIMIFSFLALGTMAMFATSMHFNTSCGVVYSDTDFYSNMQEMEDTLMALEAAC